MVVQVKVHLRLWNAKDAFRAYDRDGSGYVTATELRQVLRELGNTVSMKQAEAVVAAADKDGDGKVSYKEFEALDTAH